MALPTIRTKEFEETWIDFMMARPRVKYKLGEGPIGQIFAKARHSKPPNIAREKYPTHEKLQLLVTLCRELQIAAGSKPFFHSTTHCAVSANKASFGATSPVNTVKST